MGLVGIIPNHSDSITRSRLSGIAIYGNFLNEIQVLHGVKTRVVGQAAWVVVPSLLIKLAILSGLEYKSTISIV
jgi:hypothetical protein